MSLQNFFKFREVPDTETAKPFLEHLEDLRWTVVKMAITLFAAMILCFAFRSTLTAVMQRPLSQMDERVRTLQSLGITDSFTISFNLAFYAGIVLSFPLLLYFAAEFVLPALTAVEKRLLLPAIAASFGFFSSALSPATTGSCRRRFCSSSATRRRWAGRRRGRCANIIPS